MQFIIFYGTAKNASPTAEAVPPSLAMELSELISTFYHNRYINVK